MREVVKKLKISLNVCPISFTAQTGSNENRKKWEAVVDNFTG